MCDLPLLSVQDFGYMGDRTAKGGCDALMAETDAEDRYVDGGRGGDDGLNEGRGEAEIGGTIGSAWAGR